MGPQNPKPLFDAIRTIAGPLSTADVALINQALISAEHGDPLPTPVVGMDVSAAGLQQIKAHEGCVLTAYPDPGSRDGTPWTIGYGATGPGIQRGTVWTQAQADARFFEDIRRFEDRVEASLGGAKTTQSQFDALVSFAYNVGAKAFAGSTLLKKHIAGDYAGAAREFGRWVNNDGRRLEGLVKRRKAEADWYGRSA